MHARIVAAALIVIAAVLAPPAAQADWIRLSSERDRQAQPDWYPDPKLPQPYQAFVERIDTTLHRIFRDWRYDATDFDTALVDLDGDGMDEIFVALDSLVFCGNIPWCLTGLYRRAGDDWRLIGAFDLPRMWNRTDTPFLFLEDRTHMGWRVFHNGASRYCWTDAPDPTQPSKATPTTP